jgi:hypothetical protein
MPKGPRPKGGRPPGRRGRAGTGPGPAYRPSSSGGGTSHKSSSSATNPQLAIVYSIFIGMPVGVVLFLGAYLLHGYGLI